MLSRDDLERYLDRLSADGATTTEVEPGFWRLHPGGALDFDVVVTYTPPVVLLRAKVTHRPPEPAPQGTRPRRRLDRNATALLHGAYGGADDAGVRTDALELALLIGEVRELAALCDPLRDARRTTGEYAVPPATPHTVPSTTMPAEAR